MFKTLSLFFLIAFSCANILSAQDLKVGARLVIRDDNNHKYDEKDIEIYLKGANTKDFLACNGFIFLGSRPNTLSFMYTCVCIPMRETWKYLPEFSTDKKKCYSAKCIFGYNMSESSPLVKVKVELLLRKYSDGPQEVMIVGYDGERTLVFGF